MQLSAFRLAESYRINDGEHSTTPHQVNAPMPIRNLIAVLIAICLPAVSFASSLPDGPYVSTSASAVHRVDPDYAVIDLDFRTVQATAEAAREQANAAQKRLLAVLEGYEDALRDTKLESLRFGREYEYDRQQQKNVEAGFFGQFAFRIEISDLDRLSRLHFELAAMDWNSLGEPRFEVSDTESARDAAREKALERATAQARGLARAQGGRLGQPWGIIFEPMHELAGRMGGPEGGQMQRYSMGVATADAEFAIPMAPRPVEFEARVGVVFRLDSNPD